MQTRSYADDGVRFIERAEAIVSRLELGVGIGSDELQTLSSYDVAMLKRVLLDLKATAAQVGVAGVKPYKLAAETYSRIAAAAEACSRGDAALRLDYVYGAIASLRCVIEEQLRVEPVPDAEDITAKSARAVAASHVDAQAARANMPNQGTPRLGASADEVGNALSSTARRILKAMLAYGAFGEQDRISADGIIDEIFEQCGVTKTRGEIRRPMDELKRNGLTGAAPGKGTWLTPFGIEVAKSL